MREVNIHNFVCTNYSCQKITQVISEKGMQPNYITCSCGGLLNPITIIDNKTALAS